MKKAILSVLVLSLLCSVSFANCCENSQKASGQNCQKDLNKCDRCTIEDDEYCIYNQCFFDKQFRKMKTVLCLTKKQETCIDNIYRNYKSDFENVCSKYRTEKNKLLEMIACQNDCYKDQVKVVKNIKKEAKEKTKEFLDDVKEQLCKDQYSEFRKFKRAEKKIMKKLIKYGAIYKLPCVDCCSK